MQIIANLFQPQNWYAYHISTFVAIVLHHEIIRGRARKMLNFHSLPLNVEWKRGDSISAYAKKKNADGYRPTFISKYTRIGKNNFLHVSCRRTVSYEILGKNVRRWNSRVNFSLMISFDLRVKLQYIRIYSNFYIGKTLQYRFYIVIFGITKCYNMRGYIVTFTLKK